MQAEKEDRSPEEIQSEVNAAFEVQSPEELQAELDARYGKDPPMFASFDPDLVDQSALPIPPFTAYIILGLSLYATYYMIDTGLHGFPEGANPL